MAIFLIGSGREKDRQILKVIWALLCQYVITDQRSNNISLIEVIDGITIPAPPPVNVPETSQDSRLNLNASLVALYARSDHGLPEVAQSRLRIVSPEGAQILSEEQEVDLTDATRARAIGQIIGLPTPLPQDGEYLLKIEVKAPDSGWEEAFELPLWVDLEKDVPSE